MCVTVCDVFQVILKKTWKASGKKKCRLNAHHFSGSSFSISVDRQTCILDRKCVFSSYYFDYRYSYGFDMSVTSFNLFKTIQSSTCSAHWRHYCIVFFSYLPFIFLLLLELISQSYFLSLFCLIWCCELYISFDGGMMHLLLHVNWHCSSSISLYFIFPQFSKWFHQFYFRQKYLGAFLICVVI